MADEQLCSFSLAVGEKKGMDGGREQKKEWERGGKGEKVERRRKAEAG